MPEEAKKRATVYFDPALHRALQLKAAETDYSISDLVDDAVEQALVEDAEDLEAFEAREYAAEFTFEEIVKLISRNSVD